MNCKLMVSIKGLLTNMVILFALIIATQAIEIKIWRQPDCKTERSPCKDHRECCDPTVCYGRPGDRHCKKLNAKLQKLFEEAYEREMNANKMNTCTYALGVKCSVNDDCCPPHVCHSTSGHGEDLKCKQIISTTYTSAIQNDRYIYDIYKKKPIVESCSEMGTRCDDDYGGCCKHLSCQYVSHHTHECQPET